MSKTVVIGCRHPCGIVLDLTDNTGNTVKVKLNGQNSAQARSPIILLSEDDCGYTDVDSDFWEAWKLAYKGYQPLVTGMIFEAKTRKDAEAIQEEIKDEPTGHEPLAQTAAGVEPSA